MAFNFSPDKNWMTAYKTRYVSLNKDESGTLLDLRNSIETKAEIYVTALYFVITTMTTVGYGDITQVTILERCLAILILIIGSVLFSFLAGSVV